jgi:SagB-type dehydrogenase family enzyme
VYLLAGTIHQIRNERGITISLKAIVRIRRARTLLISWRDNKLVFTNFRTRKSVSATPETVRLLHSLNDWTEQSDLSRLFPEYSEESLRDAIRILAKHSFLVAEGTRQSIEDERVQQVWSSWLPDGSFHFATKDVQFLGEAHAGRMMESYLEESPQPSLLKSYPDASRATLPKVSPTENEFVRILMSRRTHRAFSKEAITTDAVSKLLFYTWGVHGCLDSLAFGHLFHKTSPSGGARHPGEVYLLAIRVSGLTPGLYHYDGLNHELAWIRSLDVKKKAVEYTADQKFLKDASALFIMTAVFPRVQWKYRFARAYRVVLLDAGHLCQTFCLVATWLGLAPFCTAALRDTAIEQDLGIDGINESVLYIAGVGTLVSKTRRRR